MSDHQQALNNVRQLLALDADAGIEFYLRDTPTTSATPSTTPAVNTARTAEITPRPTVSSSITSAPKPAADAQTTTKTLAPVAKPILPASTNNNSSLSDITNAIAACKACRLCDGRRNTVPGEGNPAPTLLFVGEGPGADEDEQGRPFVGAAGQLLTKMIEAMGLKRDEVFIANVVKCRPPGNRTPEADEVNACLPFLEQQIALLKPKIICALGNTPLRALTGDDKAGITRMRGQKLSYRGITMIPTFHPSYLLRNPEAKKPCWDDLKLVLAEMGKEPPKR
jgi:uracil-DNA glycosylase